MNIIVQQGILFVPQKTVSLSFLHSLIQLLLVEKDVAGVARLVWPLRYTDDVDATDTDVRNYMCQMCSLMKNKTYPYADG